MNDICFVLANGPVPERLSLDIIHVVSTCALHFVIACSLLHWTISFCEGQLLLLCEASEDLSMEDANI